MAYIFLFVPELGGWTVFCLHHMAQIVYYSVFRLADVIFLIYLYQRWVYPVDKKRVNEFGFAGEDENQASASAEITDGNEGEKKTN